MKTKRIVVYRPKYTKKNTNNSKMPTKKTVKHKTIKRRTYNKHKPKNLARNWIDDFLYEEETVFGGGKNNKRTDGAGTKNYPNFNKSLQSNVKKSTVKKVSVKKSTSEIIPVKPSPNPSEVATPNPSEVATPNPSEVATPNPSEVATPNPSEVATDKTIKEDTEKNKDNICPSRDKTPHQPLDRSDYLKESLIFHPDENKGCVDSANEKFLQLSKMEELRNNSTETNDITQSNSIVSTGNSEEPVADNTAAIPVTDARENPRLDTDIEKISVDNNTLKTPEPNTTNETGHNNSGIGKFDVSISYPNGLDDSPIVNLTGKQGGDTDAVFGAIAQESGTPSSDAQTIQSIAPATQSLSKLKGGKSNRRKKNNQTKKHKKGTNKLNKSLKLRNKKL